MLSVSLAGRKAGVADSKDESDLVSPTTPFRIPRIHTAIQQRRIDGFGILPSAQQVVQDHLASSKSVEEAIDSIIAWRTAHAAGTGFVTGLGGIATLPVTISASLATSYVLGANAAAAIAYLRGHNIKSDQVRTMILLCLLGESGEVILRQAGIQVGKKSFEQFIKQIPSKTLTAINQKVGYRLVTKFGEKGVVNLVKLVPIAGGFIGAGFDATFVNLCGQTVKKVFPQKN